LRILAGGCASCLNVPQAWDDTHDAAARGGKTALTVYSYNQAAAITGLARRTLERLIALGEGPAIIELSPRRRGILESDLIRWLHKRRRAAAVDCEPEREGFALIHFPPTALGRPVAQ
jgi:hypothetical protein